MLGARVGETLGQPLQQAALDSVQQEEVRHLFGGNLNGTGLALAQGFQNRIRTVGKIREAKVKAPEDGDVLRGLRFGLC